MLIAPLVLILVLSIVSTASPGWSGKTKGLWKADPTVKHLTIVRSMTVISIVTQLALLACLLSSKPVKPALLITLVVGVLISSTISVAVYKPSHGMKKGYSYWLQATALGLMMVVGGLLTADTLGGKHSQFGPDAAPEDIIPYCSWNNDCSAMALQDVPLPLRHCNETREICVSDGGILGVDLSTQGQRNCFGKWCAGGADGGPGYRISPNPFDLFSNLPFPERQAILQDHYVYDDGDELELDPDNPDRVH